MKKLLELICWANLGAMAHEQVTRWRNRSYRLDEAPYLEKYPSAIVDAWEVVRDACGEQVKRLEQEIDGEVE
jgi:hypothetical protein